MLQCNTLKMTQRPKDSPVIKMINSPSSQKIRIKQDEDSYMWNAADMQRNSPKFWNCNRISHPKRMIGMWHLASGHLCSFSFYLLAFLELKLQMEMSVPGVTRQEAGVQPGRLSPSADAHNSLTRSQVNRRQNQLCTPESCQHFYQSPIKRRLARF